MTTEEKTDNAAREGFGVVDHGMRLLTSRFFSHLHALFKSNSKHTSHDDKVLGLSTLRKDRFAVSALPVLLASLSHEIF